MKPKYTFLLSLTFLFLFSGSVYGGVIDKKIGNVVLSCKMFSDYIWYYSINLKDKFITGNSNIEGREIDVTTYKIVEENEFFIKGIEKPLRFGVTESSILITRHDYGEGVSVIEKWTWGVEKENKRFCSIGDKRF